MSSYIFTTMKPIHVLTHDLRVKVQQQENQWLIDEQPVDFKLMQTGNLFIVHTKEAIYEFECLRQEDQKITLKGPSGVTTLHIENPLDAVLEKMGIHLAATVALSNVKSPMPGVILEVNVAPGSEVKKGDKLLVLEAMKMENVIKSPIDGQIASIHVTKGESVEKNHVLITF